MQEDMGEGTGFVRPRNRETKKAAAYGGAAAGS